MPAKFLSLPGEIRNEIYKYLLVTDEPIPPWRHENRGLAPNILSTNSTILHEGRGFLYGRNTFDLASMYPNTRFLDIIGHSSASHIRSIRIQFLATSYGDGCIATVGGYCAGFLDKIGSYCTSLETLTTAVGYDWPFALLGYINAQGSEDPISLVDRHFRKIPSLTEIIIEAEKDASRPDIRMQMESHGWTLKVVEWKQESYIEESSHYYESDFDAYDYDDDEYNYDDDEYDIDNDSDFWRRAAD